MKKSLFISTIGLILLSVIAKIASFVVRIQLARGISMEAMSFYSLVSPTMLILITIAQMGIPSAISKVIAQKVHYQKPLFSALLFTICSTTITVMLFTLCIPFIASYFYHDIKTSKILFAIVPLVPLVALSGLCKGYLLGKRKHMLSISSQVIEELARIVFLFFLLPIYQGRDPYSAAAFAMFSISIGEFASSLYMMVCMKLNKAKLYAFPNSIATLTKQHLLEVLNISIPMTSSRMIGSLTFFLEPILMLWMVKENNHPAMIQMYGAINGYLLPLLTMPSFLSVTLSQMLLPAFTYRIHHQQKGANRLCALILSVCLFIGASCSMICFFFPNTLLTIFYHQQIKANTLKQLAIPFILYALQPPLTSMLHAISKSKEAMWDTIYGSALRLACICFLAPLLHEVALPLGLASGMCLTTLLHFFRFIQFLHKQ